MATVIATYTFQCSHPIWLLTGLVAVPAAWLAWRNLASLGRGRRIAALSLRVVVILLLALLLAGPTLSRKRDNVTVVLVLDRSHSIPDPLQDQGLTWLRAALAEKRPGDRIAVIDVAERAVVEYLDTAGIEIKDRAGNLMGGQSFLEGGLQLAMAIAPPDSAVRILFVSDGNETVGSVADAASLAAANHIPIDVLALRYSYPQEVVLKRLVVPQAVRRGQTISVRFVLHSTAAASGTLRLSLNGSPVDLDPSPDESGAHVELRPGTNIRTFQIPVGDRGLYEFQADFVPDAGGGDTMPQNNNASAMTYVAGPGQILVLDRDGEAGKPIADALDASGMSTRMDRVWNLPTELPQLMDIDAVVLVNAPCSDLTLSQQDMLRLAVQEMGVGLVMVGGPDSFGAGGWIGSPVAEVIPVDMDPSQRKVMPKGALVLIMHSCEMPDGNFWGKEVATAAVKTLGAQDLVGVISFQWDSSKLWDFPLGPAGDKYAVVRAINTMQMGDMPDFGAPMEAAYQALQKTDAVQKHVIMISDGDPSSPSGALLAKYRAAGITCTGVAVFPHSPSDVGTLKTIAETTGGRFYHVTNPNSLPQIFIKEAQTVRRSLIVEKDFTPAMTGSPSEIVRGLGGALPPLKGYVLTKAKGGLAELLVTGPEDDPIMAAQQAGVGRCVAFTSSADSRWADRWIAWGGFERFWEQTVRWAGKGTQSRECEVFADVQGRQVTVTVEARDTEGRSVQFSQVRGRAVGPGMEPRDFTLSQVGPGQFRGTFTAGEAGGHFISIKYAKGGAEASAGTAQTVVDIPYAPEYADLSDNAALLADVARETGGRMLEGEPETADLFYRGGLVFPLEPLPTVAPLVILWLVVFILDVAVRRVVIDVRAAAAGVVETVRGIFGRVAPRGDETVVAMRRARRRVAERVGLKSEAAAHAGRRFEPAAVAEDESLPDEEFLVPLKPVGPSADDKKPESPAEPAELDRLVQARRARRDPRKRKSDPPS